MESSKLRYGFSIALRMRTFCFPMRFHLHGGPRQAIAPFPIRIALQAEHNEVRSAPLTQNLAASSAKLKIAYPAALADAEIHDV